MSSSLCQQSLVFVCTPAEHSPNNQPNACVYVCMHVCVYVYVYVCVCVCACCHRFAPPLASALHTSAGA